MTAVDGKWFNSSYHLLQSTSCTLVWLKLVEHIYGAL